MVAAATKRVATATILAASVSSLSLSLAGCGGGGFVTSPADYAAYRSTRVAPTLEARLAAADRYLTAYPDGAFAGDVRASFDRAEPVFFAARVGTIDGLRAYREALPSGPHHAEVEKQLARLEAQRDRRDLAVAEDVTTEVDRATRDRALVRAALSTWIGLFLDASLWDAPLSQAKKELIIPWTLSLPELSCATLEAGAKASEGLPPPRGATRRCTKLFELPYAVVVEGRSEDREATLELTLFQDAEGHPLEARIGGPDLFLRLEETFAIRALPRGEPEPRVAAMARTAELVRGVFMSAVPAGSQCKRAPAAPIFLDLACAGLHLSARSAVGEGEDDLILIRPER